MSSEIKTLNADAKLVYKASTDDLVALCDKYGVSTDALRTSRRYAGVALGTNANMREMQTVVYAEIKRRIRKAGGN